MKQVLLVVTIMIMSITTVYAASDIRMRTIRSELVKGEVVEEELEADLTVTAEDQAGSGVPTVDDQQQSPIEEATQSDIKSQVIEDTEIVDVEGLSTDITDEAATAVDEETPMINTEGEEV